MYLRNKTAVITGISKGLGKAFAHALLAQGVRVIGWGRSRPEYGHEHLEFISCDVRDPESVEAALSATQALTDRIDILINNAGLGVFAPIDQLTLEQWREVMETNLTGVFLVTRAIVPVMKAQRSGHIVNVSSIAGRVGMPQGEAYNASKFGVTGFSECLFQELRGEGIKVTTVYPGSASTHFFDQIEGMSVHDNMMRPEDIARTVVHVLDTPPNYLIREVEMRPLISKPAKR